MLVGLQQSKGAFVPPSQHKSIKFSAPYKNNDATEKNENTLETYKNKELTSSETKDEPGDQTIQDIKKNIDIAKTPIAKTEDQITKSNDTDTVGSDTAISRSERNNKFIKDSTSLERTTPIPNDHSKLTNNHTPNDVIALHPTICKKKNNQLAGNVNVQEETIESDIQVQVIEKPKTQEISIESLDSYMVQEVPQNRVNIKDEFSKEEQKKLTTGNISEHETVSQKNIYFPENIAILKKKLKDF